MDQERRSVAEDFTTKLLEGDPLAAGIPITVSPYMKKGETWLLEGHLLVTPWNDLVWENTWEKILRAEREIAQASLDRQILALKRAVGMPA